MGIAFLRTLFSPAMNKKRNEELLKLADVKLKASNLLLEDKESIDKSYDGDTAALSVSVAMSGLLPTVVIYYQDFDNRNPDAPCRRNVLNVVATMITVPNTDECFADAKALLSFILNGRTGLEEEVYLKALKQLEGEVIDCAIALKQVVRTYNLVEK